MTPDEMIQSLENWIQVCKDRRQKARMRKLQTYRETLRGMMNVTRMALDNAALTSQPLMRPDPTQLHEALSDLPPVEKSWRDKAREYGISMLRRKREDVEADIEAHEANLAKEIKPAIEGADAPDG